MARTKKQPCNTKYCRNHAKRSGLCWPCYNKRSRDKNPIRYAYQTLKDNAKRRGVPFTITLEYFKRFCRPTLYIAGRGRSKDSYTIDRKKNHLGYVKGNLQVMTRSDNSHKGIKEKVVLDYDWTTRTARVIREGQKKESVDDLPF